MAQAAIEITDLVKTYAGSGRSTAKTALTGVTLNVPKGKIFGFLGPNGAGKSTLINILAGLVTKTSGTVAIAGYDLDTDPRRARRAIGVMPQELNLDPFFTPRASLDVQAGLYGIPKPARKTEEILEFIGLSDKADAYARTLSGGMRRRLLLGKALVHSPEILVLDEPTAGVDLELREMLWTNIRRLQSEGTTVILTTHYLEEAQEMCDEIAIIDKGAIRAIDSKANLLGQIRMKTLFVVPSNTKPKDLTVPNSATVTVLENGTYSIAYDPHLVSAEDLLDSVRAAGVSIADLSTQDPDLEDVFRALTGD